MDLGNLELSENIKCRHSKGEIELERVAFLSSYFE
jgi:hypothetical protein